MDMDAYLPAPAAGSVPTYSESNGPPHQSAWTASAADENMDARADAGADAPALSALEEGEIARSPPDSWTSALALALPSEEVEVEAGMETDAAAPPQAQDEHMDSDEARAPLRAAIGDQASEFVAEESAGAESEQM